MWSLSLPAEWCCPYSIPSGRTWRRSWSIPATHSHSTSAWNSCMNSCHPRRTPVGYSPYCRFVSQHRRLSWSCISLTRHGYRSPCGYTWPLCNKTGSFQRANSSLLPPSAPGCQDSSSKNPIRRRHRISPLKTCRLCCRSPLADGPQPCRTTAGD